MIDLTIVGGTYQEVCLSPKWNELYGSGLRAACCIGDLCNTTLITRIEEASVERLSERAALHSFTAQSILRRYPVSFQYDHSLGKPRVYPDIRDIGSINRIEASADNVLGFSFIEDVSANTKVVAKQLVFDPQAGRSARLPSASGFIAEQVFVVCNFAEAQSLLSKASNHPLELAADIQYQLIGKENICCFVVKCGPNGALVVTEEKVEQIPFFDTPRVFPIGSGDIFSSWFAFELFANGNTPSESALRASAATSLYCEHRFFPTRKAVQSRIKKGDIGCLEDLKRPIVYLASGFFSISELWLLNEAKRCLTEMECDYFSPMDEIGLLNEGVPANVIVEGDLKGLRDSNVVLALLDTMDPGTIFEIGYAVALGKPVVCFVQNKSSQSLTMVKGSSLCSVHDDLASAIYKVASLGRRE